MKLLVTGVNGWLASAFAQHCCTLGYDVRGTSRVGGANIVQIPNIDGGTDWAEALIGCDVVVHLAARVHAMHDHEADSLAIYREVNTAGAINLARQAAAHQVKRFVFVSSVKVNGERTIGANAFRETDLPKPLDPYGLSKLEAEAGLFAIAAETSMEVVVIRPPLVYGPGVKGNFSVMMQWVKRGLPLPLSAIDNARSMVALENLVDFMTLCADYKRSSKAANELFLVCDDEPVSTPDVLKKIALVLDRRLHLLPVPVRVLQLVGRLTGQTSKLDRLIESLIVDSSKAREVLGWKPVISMDKQLEKMVLHDSFV